MRNLLPSWFQWSKARPRGKSRKSNRQQKEIPRLHIFRYVNAMRMLAMCVFLSMCVAEREEALAQMMEEKTRRAVGLHHMSTYSHTASLMITLNERLKEHIGAVWTPWDNKMFISDPNSFRVRRAFLDKYTTMYIYCDAVKYQIIGDTQAPLLATLPIQGISNEQCVWSFNPPY